MDTDGKVWAAELALGGTDTIAVDVAAESAVMVPCADTAFESHGTVEDDTKIAHERCKPFQIDVGHSEAA